MRSTQSDLATDGWLASEDGQNSTTVLRLRP